MDWYAVHVVMAIYLKAEFSETFPVYENVFLIHASTEQEAVRQGVEIGECEEGDSEGSLTWDGKPAMQKFMGVRKTVLCVDSRNRPTEKTEITYSQFLFSSEGDVKKFCRGQSVSTVAVE